ncbi:HpcH/HpaI aldolase/citrate lyase family protein [Amycolatopsis sp. NPDC049868]|uniref:HpcH/HpaI aldolase/citrate lyase family protein n=1 Tax=Amycolatopsis sp. NPDC049868 TaxID=3363934 RepID=UPI0037921B36
MAIDIANARTLLFAPGHRPDRFAKAAASGADAVVLDLEDAVGTESKEQARAHVRTWLSQGHRALVRINAPATPWHADDLGLIREFDCPVMLPKAEDPSHVDGLSAVVPLLETALGIAQAVAVCSAPGVIRPAFGSVDLAAQLGVDHRSHEALRYARSSIVLAAAAAGCAAPIDGVTTALHDEATLRADLDEAVTIGYTGKLCVHPNQIGVANRRLGPTDAEIEWARSVLTGSTNDSVTVHDGEMIDRPVLLRARAILARA